MRLENESKYRGFSVLKKNGKTIGFDRKTGGNMIKKASLKAIVVITLLCTLLVSSALFIGGCKDKGGDKVTYTIVYDSQGGAAVKNGTYTEGGRFYLPTPSIGSDPKMYGYTFTGWYYDSACTKKADKNLDTTYARNDTITLYAGWSNLHKIYFDTRTSEIIEPVEYRYGATVVTAELPKPADRVVGSATCKFVSWAFTNTNDKVGETFVMEPVDVYLFAVYDTGVNSRFELNDEGYYVPTGTNGTTTQTRFRDYTLKNGQIYSVDMTLPADWNDYTDDCGPVFSATAFNDEGTTFIGAPYVTMFISAPSKNNGAIEFWGDVDNADGSSVSAQLIARYKLGGELLKGTPYEAKMLAYQESNEEATFTLTFRRVEQTVDGTLKVSYYVGIDGVEYVCFTTGEKAVRYSEIGNKDRVFSAKHVGDIVGLRAKTKGVKYSNVTVKNADEVNVNFYAQRGAELLESKTYAYGATTNNLPEVTRDGFDFAGWFYTDYITGEKKELTSETVVTANMHNIDAVAQWRKAGAKPYTVKFNTGIDGYEVKGITGWYEGNEISLPELSYPMMQFDGNWYYEAECINVVDFDNIDATKANITGADTAEPVLTIYAKAAKKEFLSGEGTEENPFLVENEADLAKFAEFVTSGETLAGYYIRLENDVNVSGGFAVIGNSKRAFSGYFDGNGKTVTGVNVEGESYLGMFAVLHNATVKNLTIEGNVNGSKGTNGLLAGQIQSGTTVENVTTKGSVVGVGTDIGGLIGSSFRNGDGEIVIKNCVNYANVSATAASAVSVSATGGILGATAAGCQTYVTDSKNYGKVSTNATFGGGIVGLLRVVSGNEKSKVTGCFNFGDVSAAIQAGGIVGGSRDVIENGYVLSSAKINGTEAKDLVLDGEAKTYVGAIAGRLEGAAAKRIGGGLCDENGKIVYVKITAVLDTAGGTLPEGIVSPVEVNAEVAVLEQLPVPAKVGYRFDRWELKVTSGEGEEQTVKYETITETTVFNGPAHTVELVARYVEQVTITVNPDGGEYDGETTIVIDKGDKLPADALGTPVKAGYTFLGWFNGADRITAQDVYEANTEIVAKYEVEAQKSEIRFISDEKLVTTKELVVGDPIEKLPVPDAKAGYRFDGWLDVDGNKITEESTFSASVVELYAKWVLQTVITFDANGGTIVGNATKTIDAGSAIGEMPEATSSTAGEVFGGWLSSDGKLVDETTMFASNVTAVTLTASFGWDGVAVSESLSGEGTEESPYVIGSGADLAFLAGSVNGGESYGGKYFVLAKNINLNFKAWTPVGKVADKTFSGIFDGKNFAVENVTDSLFGYASGATFRNLTVNVKIEKTTMVGGLVAQTKGSACTIENVIVKGSVASSAANVAGIVGNANGVTTIKNCKNYANITSTCTASLAFAGGIMGSSNAKIIIDSCENYGEINALKTMIGGIAGLPRKADGSYVANCKNFGNVTGSSQVGGICGATRVRVEYSYCLSTALINGKAASELGLWGYKTSPASGSDVPASIVGQIDTGAGNADCGDLISCGLCDASGNLITNN